MDYYSKSTPIIQEENLITLNGLTNALRDERAQVGGVTLGIIIHAICTYSGVFQPPDPLKTQGLGIGIFLLKGLQDIYSPGTRTISGLIMALELSGYSQIF